jgi:hypothetical protein
MSCRRFVIPTLLCLASLVASCSRTPSTALDPESAANAFFAAVENGDTRAAYDSSAFGFQAAQTYEAFLSNAQALGLIHGKPPVWTHRQISATEARFRATVINKAGDPIDLNVVLTPDGAAWKLFSLDTNAPIDDSGTEDPFTLVGKGTGFNDVYHQPIPQPDQLVALVHDTMSRFNNAIQKADFQDFYNSVAQQWKDGNRDTGEPANGVTATMLKDHFQPFIDKKVDLSELASLTPVFDSPPLINPDGLLELDGHFSAKEFRANFSLEYVYELPRWKLFGININLTK